MNKDYAADQQYYNDSEQYVDEVQQKQEYLRINIIDMGYDANRFATFLNEKKPGVGIDVNYYNMNELYEYVVEFQNREYDMQQNNYDTNAVGATENQQSVNGQQEHIIDVENLESPSEVQKSQVMSSQVIQQQIQDPSPVAAA